MVMDMSISMDENRRGGTIGKIISTSVSPEFKDIYVTKNMLGIIVSRLIYYATTKEGIHPKYPAAEPKLRPWFDHRTQKRAAVRDYVMTTSSSLSLMVGQYDIHGKQKYKPIERY